MSGRRRTDFRKHTPTESRLLRPEWTSRAVGVAWAERRRTLLLRLSAQAPRNTDRLGLGVVLVQHVVDEPG